MLQSAKDTSLLRHIGIDTVQHRYIAMAIKRNYYL